MNEKTTLDQVQTYYWKGLTAKEIAKLMDLSERTIHRYMKQAQCKELTKPKTRESIAIDLKKKGFSYSEIAQKMKVSKTTVYLWHRKAKQQHIIEMES